MSGDLKNPSKSIPKGTLAGLALTFVSYLLVILAMAASITRQSFYNNVNVIQIVRSPRTTNLKNSSDISAGQLLRYYHPGWRICDLFLFSTHGSDWFCQASPSHCP